MRGEWLLLWLLATPFDHPTHFEAMGEAPGEARCDRCHPGDGSADRVRPGGAAVAAHATCSDGACHVGAFGPRAEPGAVCATCHAAGSWAQMSAMAPFPVLDPLAGELCVSFSHAQHAERGALAEGCDGCHRVGREGADGPMSRGHAGCVGCHDGRGEAFDMGGCAGCHRTATPDAPCRPTLRAARSVLRGFSHATHASARDRRTGRAPGCGDCHRGVAQAGAGEIELLGRGKATMNGACRGCHDGRGDRKSVV